MCCVTGKIHYSSESFITNSCETIGYQKSKATVRKYKFVRTLNCRNSITAFQYFVLLLIRFLSKFNPVSGRHVTLPKNLSLLYTSILFLSLGVSLQHDIFLSLYLAFIIRIRTRIRIKEYHICRCHKVLFSNNFDVLTGYLVMQQVA